jgi:hypothetical protein
MSETPKSLPRVRICPQCFGAHKYSSKMCPHCGFMKPTTRISFTPVSGAIGYDIYISRSEPMR